MDMKSIVSACQLMDKCFEQRVPLHQVFVDLTKAFNTVKLMYSCSTRDLGNLDVQFVKMFKQLHRNTCMKARLNVDGSLSEPIPIDKGVKAPAPVLFSIYFAVMLSYTFQDCNIGVYMYIRFNSLFHQQVRKLFSLLSKKSCSQMMQISLLIREKPYSYST